MSRAPVFDEQVREVQQALSTLFLTCGSVNKLSNLLNEFLARDGAEQKIYPNRIHTLLSGDASRGVNAKTLRLVQRAVALSDWKSAATDPGISTSLSGEVEHRWVSSTKTRGEIQRIAVEFTVPSAVVEFLLRKAGLLPTLQSLSNDISDGIARRADSFPHSLSPDYSFQERAIKQCRAALRRDKGRRVGLISPTGSGKTEMALQIALEELHDSIRKDSKVFWVTHRKNLRAQARQRLQKILARGVRNIPDNASSLLADRVEFLMVREAQDRLRRESNLVELVIIDEAHHAAAGSYDPIFESLPPLPVLALTATPNRTDGLPIRIDEIAFTITYKELVERNVILMPEFIPFPVAEFNWTEQTIDDLADHLISNTSDKYQKVLVIAPQIERVEEFYRALVKRLENESDHVLDPEDLAFLHSQGNSEGRDSESFINAFLTRPRGILVSAQMLLEGFDDPQIDTVVITYPTSSLITLMQAAGRCVRHAPGKHSAYVIQARDDRASYYFEQRWLYQDISDFARPQLLDVEYRNHVELITQLEAVLRAHNVADGTVASILTEAQRQTSGETCQLLLAGLPYFEQPADFVIKAKWTGALLGTQSKSLIVTAFNEFCSRGQALVEIEHLTPLVDDLARRLSLGRFELWQDLHPFVHNLFISTQNAVREVYGIDPANYVPGGRLKPENHSTSWLKYITFHHRPTLSQDVVAFLSECVNKAEIIPLLEGNTDVALLLRVPLPLVGFEAFALSKGQYDVFSSARVSLVSALQTAIGLQQLSSAAAFIATLNTPQLPYRLLQWIDMFSREDFFSDHSLYLGTDADDADGRAFQRTL
jgi:superfamily II DNA or RNA helicase